ncbi:MAG: hypothetical protein RLZZ508_722 [Actinomycetota bacterium]|jgi:hypothetical protein
MPDTGDMKALRQRLAELQGFNVDESLTEEELSNRITDLILDSELPKYEDALSRLGDS